MTAMKFKKGTKVEVLTKTVVPSRSWRCGEVIYGNGPRYYIRYDGLKDTSGEAIVETVSHEAIRPCPPALEVTKDWIPGDVVEVCQNSSWAMAIVVKVLGKKYILVRLLGSSLEFKVNKFDIRVRQCWQDDKWIIIGKGGCSCESGKRDNLLAPRLNLISRAQVLKTTAKRKLSFDRDHLHDEKEVNFLNSHLVYSKPLKLGSHSPAEVYAGPPQKYRATEIDGLGDRTRVANPSTLLNQVHGVVFPRGVEAEEYVAASLNNRKIGFSKMDIKRKKQTDAVDCSFAENFGSNDGDSVSSSVGSCSINNRSAYKLRHPVSADPPEDIEGAISDAESVSDCRYEEWNWSLRSEEELAAEIHRAELGAYRCCFQISTDDVGACYLSLG